MRKSHYTTDELMPTFLSDPPFFLYIILVLGTIVSFAVWVNKRNRPSLVVFGCFLATLALVFLLDRLFESPREESVRRIKEMAKAVDDRNTEAFLSHIADKFEYQGESEQLIPITREYLRQAGMWTLLKQYNVHVGVWESTREDVTEVDENTIEIGFFGKAEAEGKQAPMYFRARFTRQADGQMKLTRLASYDFVKQKNERKSIPNFP
jgi:hypothetical protein